MEAGFLQEVSSHFGEFSSNFAPVYRRGQSVLCKWTPRQSLRFLLPRFFCQEQISYAANHPQLSVAHLLILGRAFGTSSPKSPHT